MVVERAQPLTGNQNYVVLVPASVCARVGIDGAAYPALERVAPFTATVIRVKLVSNRSHLSYAQNTVNRSRFRRRLGGVRDYHGIRDFL